MRGAIIGDVCASIYEHRNHKTDEVYDINLQTPSCRFTDDTVLATAVAEACMAAEGGGPDYAGAVRKWGRMYPDAGYGGRFRQWLGHAGGRPYGSYGNGSAMRVSPIGWLYNTLEETLGEASKSADITHNHPEGVKGAQAVAAAIFWARTGRSKDYIRKHVTARFAYDLERSIASIRPGYTFDVSCQGSVPEAIIAFLESRDFEHALRLAISIGGDSDTIACIAGSIAEAFYDDIPRELWDFTQSRLSNEMLAVVERFSRCRIAPVRPCASDYGGAMPGRDTHRPL